MLIYRRLLFIFVKQSVNIRFCNLVIYSYSLFTWNYVAYSRVYFCARNFHSGRICYEKPAPKTGARSATHYED